MARTAIKFAEWGELNGDISNQTDLYEYLEQITEDPTTLSTTIASKGGVYNGDFSIVPTGTDPTTTTTRWVDGTAGGSTTNDTYGWSFIENDGSASSVFDTISKNGSNSIKLSTLDTSAKGRLTSVGTSTTLATLKKYGSPLKASTTYRLSCWVKTNNAASNSVYIGIIQYDDSGVVGTTIASSKLSGTNDWTKLTVTFTSDSDASVGALWLYNFIAGNVSDAWFDDISLTEVTSITDNTNKSPEKIDLSFTGVTDNTSIDQSLDPTGAYTNTYAVPQTTIDEGATHRQTFTPTKKKQGSIGIYIVDKGTGDWTLTVHDASNNLLSWNTIANASLVNGLNLFQTRYDWSSGALHFHLTSTQADGTAKTNTTDDIEAGSFIGCCLRPTEQFGTTVNGIPTVLKGNADGLFGTWNLGEGKWRYDTGTPVTSINAGLTNPIYSYVPGGVTNASGTFQVLGGGGAGNAFTSAASGLTSVGVSTSLTWKFKSILPIKSINIWTTNFVRSTTNTYLPIISISTDNVNWTTLLDYTTYTSAGEDIRALLTPNLEGETEFYIRTTTGGARVSQVRFEIEADIDTSSIPMGLIYPLEVLNFSPPPIYLPTAPTYLYYRTNKYTNEFGEMCGALEFTDASANPLGRIMLPLCNGQETNPCISLLSTSTGYQQVGTGSAVTGGYILNADERQTLLGSNNTFNINYQVGTGTTAITAITKNSVYTYSNGATADSTQDPSMQQIVTVGYKSSGLTSIVGNIEREVQTVKEGLITRPDELTDNYLVKGKGGKEIEMSGVYLDDDDNITLPAGQKVNTTTVNAATYSLLETDYILNVTYTVTGAVTSLTLPTAQVADGRVVVVKDAGGNAGTNSITIDTEADELIDGAATYVINSDYDAITLYCDGTNWFVC